MDDLTVLYVESEMGLKCTSTERYLGIEGLPLVFLPIVRAYVCVCVCVCVSRPGGHTDTLTPCTLQ